MKEYFVIKREGRNRTGNITYGYYSYKDRWTNKLEAKFFNSKDEAVSELEQIAQITSIYSIESVYVGDFIINAKNLLNQK